MYDNVATLIKATGRTYDEYLNEKTTTEGRQVYVLPRGVYQSEFYNAAQNGLKPSITFLIANKADYDNEKTILFEGKAYNVIRVDWDAQRDGISLICEEDINASDNL